MVAAMPLAHHVLGFRQLLPPAVGSNRLLRDVAVEHGALAGLCDMRAQFAVAAKLDDSSPYFVYHTGHGKDLRVGGDVGRSKPAVPVEMTHITLEGNTYRSGLDTLADDCLHGSDLVIRGVALLGSLTHHVAAHGGMPDERGDVNSQPPVQRVEVLRDRFPRPRDAGADSL